MQTPDDQMEDIEDPDTGAFAFALSWVYAAMFGGLMLAATGGWIVRGANRRRRT